MPIFIGQCRERIRGRTKTARGEQWSRQKTLLDKNLSTHSKFALIYPHIFYSLVLIPSCINATSVSGAHMGRFIMVDWVGESLLVGAEGHECGRGNDKLPLLPPDSPSPQTSQETLLMSTQLTKVLS